MSTPQAAIIECGARRVVLGVFRRAGGRMELGQLAAVSFDEPPDAAVPGGGAHWFGQVRQALGELQRRTRHDGAVTVVVPGHLLLTKHVKVPPTTPGRRRAVVEFEAARALPFPLQDLVWDEAVARESAAGLAVLVVAARIESVERLAGAVGAAGFQVEAMTAEPLAALAAVRWLFPNGGRQRLIVHVGEHAAALILEDAGGFSLRSLPVRAAEFAARVAGEVRRTVRYYAAEHAAAEPREAVIAGWAGGGGGPEWLSAELGLPARQIDWVEVVGAAAGARGVGEAETTVSSAMIGAALGPLGWADGGRAADMSPPALRREADARRNRPWHLAAAALGMFALVPPTMHFREADLRAREKAAAIEQWLAPVRERAAEVRRRGAELAELQRRQTVLEDLAVDRHRWTGLLADLQERLDRIGGVWLDRLAVNRETGPRWRIELAGRMLTWSEPAESASEAARRRALALQAELAASPFVGVASPPRFQPAAGGLLGFELALSTEAGRTR